MNEENLNTLVSIKEGNTWNYFEAFEKLYGKSIVDNRFSYKQGTTNIKSTLYTLLSDFEFMVNQLTLNKVLVIDREPDEMPDFYHINIIKEGKVIQDYNNEQQYMEAGTPKGIFLYNGLFPLKSSFPAKHPLRSVTFKVSKQALKTVMPEAIPLFDNLFENDEPKGYHAHLSPQMDRLMDDLLNHENSDYGRFLLVNAKAFELFTEFITTTKKLLAEDELHGLHVDDYNRLMLIKEEILGKVESKISMDELAQQFAISVSKLQRDFKTLFSCSVYQFFTHAKMDEAYRRLKSGEFSVTEVGYDLGYNSLSKFSEMFKKIKGINPSEVLTV